MQLIDSPVHPARLREQLARGKPWMVTATGRRVDLLDPQSYQISIDDIAIHLARMNRFTGATAYSVAQHSVLVSRLCERMPLAGLLHDAHEAYLGDVSRPLKDALALLGAGEALKLLAARFDQVICAKYGLESDAFEAADVKAADNAMLATEKRDLLIEPACRWDAVREPLPQPLPFTIQADGSWVYVRNVFLNRFHELTE